MMAVETFAREVQSMRDAQKRWAAVGSLATLDESIRRERFVDMILPDAPDHPLTREVSVMRQLQRHNEESGTLLMDMRRREHSVDLLVREVLQPWPEEYFELGGGK